MQVSIVACFSYSLSKKLVLSSVVSAMTAIHRDHLVLALYAAWPGLQPLMPQGQIVSGDLPLLTDGHYTTIILIIIIIMMYARNRQT